MLVSAPARTVASAFGADAYESVGLNATSLITSIARIYALLDGNKRTDQVLTVAFLNINGWDLDMTQDERFVLVLVLVLVLAVAQASLEVDEIAAAFATHLVADSGAHHDLGSLPLS